MKRFGGLDGIVAYPHWLMELRNRLKFEGGNIVNAIIDGSFSLDSVQRGERVERAQDLINSLIVVNRSSVVYRRAWIEEANKEGETVEVITPDGELNMTAAVQKIKRSVFMSISAHGLKENSTLQTEFDRLKDEYDEHTLVRWFTKMNTDFGVNNKELLNAYMNQLQQLRVMKSDENTDVVKNLLEQERDEGDHGESEDPLRATCGVLGFLVA